MRPDDKTRVGLRAQVFRKKQKGFLTKVRPRDKTQVGTGRLRGVERAGYALGFFQKNGKVLLLRVRPDNKARVGTRGLSKKQKQPHDLVDPRPNGLNLKIFVGITRTPRQPPCPPRSQGTGEITQNGPNRSAEMYSKGKRIDGQALAMVQSGEHSADHQTPELQTLAFASLLPLCLLGVF